jgi:hypothetical protein
MDIRLRAEWRHDSNRHESYPPFGAHLSTLGLRYESAAMFCIAGDPGVVVPVTVVIVVPVPLAVLDYARGSCKSYQRQHEAAAHDTPRGYIP